MIRKSSQKRKPAVNNHEPKARRKIMDMLARRSYSLVELRRKLAFDEFENDEIEDAVEFAEKNNWITPPQELTRQVSTALSRKKKSAAYINHFLGEKGLPASEIDPQAELEKALYIVRSKLSKEKSFDYEEKKKIQRLLTNRGFDSTTIRMVIERK